MSTVELRSLVKDFGGVRVVDSISLFVEQGEFLTLLGPSGCGKTTTLRIIAGFETATAGSVLISGENCVGLPAYRRNVNTVFQSYALFPHLSVFDNIAFGLRRKRVPADARTERVRAAIQMVRLAGLEQRRPASLSGGQQQRVALARALVNRPSVLLLDEPLGALDLQLRRQMQLELIDLQRTLSITFIYVTHDQEEAMAMSDRVAIMKAGSILQIGAPREVYDRPASRFVAAFLGEANFLSGREVGRKGNVVALEIPRLGVLHAIDGQMVSGGQERTIAIRPESIQIDSGLVLPAVNCVQAEVRKVVFRGGDLMIEGMLASGATLIARSARSHSAIACNVSYGDRINFSWPAEAATVVNE